MSFQIPDGMTVRHYRPISTVVKSADDGIESKQVIASCGGATVAYRKGDAGEYAVGVAYCHPNDNFRGLPGVHKAVGRLVQYEKNGYVVPLGKDKSVKATDKQFTVQADDENELLARLDSYMATECGYRRKTRS